MESVSIAENPIETDQFEIECHELSRLKIGEIFYLQDNYFSMCCIHCGQEFRYFTEFSLHIQEHYRRGEIGQFFKEMDDEEECSDSQINDLKFDDKRNTKSPIDFAGDEFALLNNDFELSNELVDNGDQFQSNASHIVLEPLRKSNVSPEPFRFIAGTDYEQQNKHSYRCLICTHQSTAGWKHFRNHLITHSNTPKDILCPICCKGFAAISYVRKHVNRTHRMKITADEIREAQLTLSSLSAIEIASSETTAAAAQQQQQRQIGEVAKTFVEGEDYEKSNGRFKCLTCGREMLEHIRDHLLTHTNAKNVYCPLCEKQFIAVSYVRKHVNRAHKMKITAEEIKNAQTTIDVSNKNDDSSIDGKRKYLQCNDDDISSNKRTKQVTTGTAVSTIAQKNFECFECHRLFTGLSSLRIHLKLHSGIKYLCPYCEKIFAMRSYVRDHIVGIHGINRDEIPKDSIRQATTTESTTFSVRHPNIDETFQCIECQKSYSTKQTLHQHIKTHTTGPFLCVICGDVYKSIANLRYHMERHQADSNNRHKCSYSSCQKTYPTSSPYPTRRKEKGRKLKSDETSRSLNDDDKMLVGNIVE